MGSTTHEVVTLQIGHYSNFIGTHWWNLQEASFVYKPSDLTGPKEINHDVMFREGQNLEGEVTYTPRLVALDLKGSLHTLKQDGVLYDIPDQHEDLKWTGDVTLHQHQSDFAEKNEFLKDLEKLDSGESAEKHSNGQQCSSQDEMDVDCGVDKEAAPHVFGKKLYNLDDSVNVWSDYLRLHLHPKTIALVNEYQHGHEQVFDVFGYGTQVASRHKNRTEIEDRLHFFLEECDNLQGIHLLVDAYDGFGGVGSSIVQDLYDEYSGKSIAVMPVSPPSFPGSKPHDDLRRLLSTTLSYVNMVNHCSLLLPLSTASSLWKQPGNVGFWPHLNYKSNLMYHTSAIVGASVDTMTLPYRLENSPSLMSHVTDGLTQAGRKVLALQSSLPFPLIENNPLVHALQILGDKLPWQQLTPLCPPQTHPFSQSVVLRGIPSDRMSGAPAKNRPRNLTQYSSMDDLLHMFLNDVCSDSLNAPPARSRPRKLCQYSSELHEPLQLYLKDVCSSSLNAANVLQQPCISFSAANVLQQPCKVTAPFPHIFSEKVSASGEISKNDRSNKQGVDSVPVMTSLQSTPSVGNMITNLHQHASSLDISKLHKFTDAGLELDEFKESLDSLKSLAHNYEQQTDMESG